jgi:hypothetical protein
MFSPISPRSQSPRPPLALQTGAEAADAHRAARARRDAVRCGPKRQLALCARARTSKRE